ncbi:MAG: hypothetical protein K8R46_03385 [Pirellulales bacterium]|nr:hypothetical protein [Pirellulales bacterium]
MSKLMDKLKEAGDQRKSTDGQVNDEEHKKSAAQNAESADSASGNENVVVLDRNVWYLSMAFVTFMGLIALILSFKAFVRIQRGNQNVIKLGRVLVKQDKQIETLNMALIEIKSQSDQRLSTLREQMAGLDQEKPSEDPRIKDILKDISFVSTELDDLKVTHRGIMSKLIELNKEVNVLRKAQFYKAKYQ